MAKTSEQVGSLQIETSRKYGRLADALRHLIVTGAWPPGHRLPTRLKLQEQYGVACSTVQQALDALMDEGFVTSHGRRGTFVSATPPHLTHVAIIFPFSRDYPSQFHRGLAREAERFTRGGRKVSLFHGIDAHTDVEDYQHLLGLLRSRRLAGTVFVARIGELAELSFLHQSNLPTVAIASASRSPSLPVVFPDYPSFVDRALAHIKQQGKRRVAWLQSGGVESPIARYQEMFRAGVARHGLETRPYWIQTISPEAAPFARNIVHLLLHSEQTVRPDAIVILDDNLVESATGGVMDVGMQVPQDLLVVAHTNYPWPTPSHVPVVRLGFDVRQVLATCIDLIDTQRRGKVPVTRTLVPALFEGELAGEII